MSPQSPQEPAAAERSAFVHREIVRLTLLVLAALAAFVVTRAVAANSRSLARQDAAAWYSRGRQQLAASQVDDAVDSFRRAVAKDRSERAYRLALADALTRRGDFDGAEGVLLTLREAAPEDAAINLRLARLKAERQDVTAALRYYRNALYSPWSSEQVAERQRVRLELVRFLIAHGQKSQADAELLVLSTALPETAEARLELGQLFSQVGDDQRALEAFTDVLRLAPDSLPAQIGAGTAAFRLQDYRLAERYLRGAPATDEAGRLHEVARLVLTADPTAQRLSAAERARRLTEAFEHASRGLNMCLQTAGAAASVEDQAIAAHVQAFRTRLTRAARDPDTIDAGVDLVTRIERRIVSRCQAEAPLDRALLIIGERHQGDTR